MIVDGAEIAANILARTKVRASKLAHPPMILAITANETAATRSYLNIKEKKAEEAGCILGVQKFQEDVKSAALRAAIEASSADAIIVQLPLPEGMNTQEVCDAIPLEKDADVLSTEARMLFEDDEVGALLPPVVGAIKEILETNKVEVREKNAVVIGEGKLVGAPAAAWLISQGAKVTTVNDKTQDLAAALRAADLIVSGAGVPSLIKPEMLKEGVVLIDAGTSESSGKVVGDADPACAAKCALFTPVPGGVGPIAVAKLFENAVTLAER